MTGERPAMSTRALAIIVSFLLGSNLFAQPPQEKLYFPTTRDLTARAVVALAAVPYCVDLVWQVPLSSRLGWATAAIANPDPDRKSVV